MGSMFFTLLLVICAQFQLFSVVICEEENEDEGKIYLCIYLGI